MCMLIDVGNWLGELRWFVCGVWLVVFLLLDWEILYLPVRFWLSYRELSLISLLSCRFLQCRNNGDKIMAGWTLIPPPIKVWHLLCTMFSREHVQLSNEAVCPPPPPHPLVLQGTGIP